jgi:hypothetical protein
MRDFCSFINCLPQLLNDTNEAINVRMIDIPSTERRVIRKNLKIVCLFVPGQRSKVKRTWSQKSSNVRKHSLRKDPNVKKTCF